MGDMGRVDVRGEVNGQVVVGRNNVVINAEQGAYVAYRPEGPPELRLRARPYPGGSALRGQGEVLIGRDGELAAISAWLGSGRRVQVFGPPGIGKSALLRRCAAEQIALGRPVLHLHAADRTTEDLLQELFQACYELADGRPCEGYKPEPATLRQLLGALHVVLIVDDLQVSPDDLGTLVEATPGCRLLTAAVDRIERPEARPLRLDGLHEQHAFELLAREVGYYPGGPAADAARHLVAAVHGHPQTVLQAAAAFNASQGRGASGQMTGPPWPPGFFPVDDTALAVGTSARLSERAIGLLRPLCTLAPLPASPVLLAALGVRPDPAALAELTALRLVEVDGDNLASCGPFAVLVAQQAGVLPAAAKLAPALTHWLRTRATRYEACAEAAAIRRVLGNLAMVEDHRGVRDLARAAAPLLALSLHWGVWGQVLRYGRAAAQFLGAAADESYFAHEVHVRVIALSTASSGLAGGGGGVGYVAAHAGGGGGGGIPGPGQGGPPAPSGPPGAGSPIGSGVGPQRPRGWGIHQARHSVHHVVASHPVAVGAGGVLAAAGVAVGAATLAGGSPPVVVDGTPSITSPLTQFSTTSPTESPTNPSATQESSPVTTSPAGPRGTTPPSGPVTCQPTALAPRDFGAVKVGDTKTETVHFTTWLECDDEQALKADDPANWRTALASCPPTGGSRDCVFQVTFTPKKPGPYEAQVTMPDDGGGRDVSMQVTATAVLLPTDPPISPDPPVSPVSPDPISPDLSPSEPGPGID
ncbi:hypothetical protein [Streptomyces fractus]|uniref:ATP-binding protein n=1 Tax=Streptomyces fractus TaxID=641806 RepID=UPI003CF09C93